MDGASFKEMRRLVDDLDVATKKLKDQDGGLKAAPKLIQEMHLLASALQKTRPWAISTALFFALLGGGLAGTAAGFWYAKSQQIDLTGYGIQIIKTDDLTQIYFPNTYQVLTYKDRYWMLSFDNPNSKRQNHE
jgi:hypothetical protein